MSTPPRFSIIIATHRRPVLLARAVASLRAQTLACHQIVVVSDTDDEATDHVLRGLLGPNDLYLSRRGQPGPSQSRNLALQLVDGSHVLFLDDDDSFRPGYLAAVAAQLAAAPAGSSPLAVCYANFEVIDEAADGATKAIDLGSFPTWYTQVRNFVPNNAAIYPRETLAGLRFDADMAYEDWDFLLCAAAHGGLRHLPIDGPCVHKNAVEPGTNRGARNRLDNRILDCYVRHYSRHAPASAEVAAQRAALFSSIGLDIRQFVRPAAAAA